MYLSVPCIWDTADKGLVLLLWSSFIEISDFSDKFLWNLRLTLMTLISSSVSLWRVLEKTVLAFPGNVLLLLLILFLCRVDSESLSSFFGFVIAVLFWTKCVWGTWFTYEIHEYMLVSFTSLNGKLNFLIIKIFLLQIYLPFLICI